MQFKFLEQVCRFWLGGIFSPSDWEKIRIMVNKNKSLAKCKVSLRRGCWESVRVYFPLKFEVISSILNGKKLNIGQSSPLGDLALIGSLSLSPTLRSLARSPSLPLFFFFCTARTDPRSCLCLNQTGPCEQAGICLFLSPGHDTHFPGLVPSLEHVCGVPGKVC